MKNVAQTIVTALVVAFVATTFSAAAHAESGAKVEGQKILNAALDAHGGLDRWNSYGQFRYSVKDFPLGEKAPFNFDQTTDLVDRRHRSVGKNYTAAFDGSQAWVTPDVKTVGISPRFYLSGNFYFAAMPFVFADDAAQVRSLGDTEFQGRTYHRVGVSYPDSAGDSGDDAYVIYFDTETKRLHMIDFTVTYGQADPTQAPHKAMIFHDFATADGLLVPARVSFYGWADGKLQGDPATYTLHSHTFEKDRPADSDFVKPENAVIDAPPAK